MLHFDKTWESIVCGQRPFIICSESYPVTNVLCIALYYVVLHCTVLCCVVLYCTVLCVLNCIVLHCVALYCTVLYCIVLYCIVLWLNKMNTLQTKLEEDEPSFPPLISIICTLQISLICSFIPPFIFITFSTSSKYETLPNTSVHHIYLLLLISLKD